MNKISIPLNQYSYFAAFKNQLHPNIKTNILIRLENDNNIIFRFKGSHNKNAFVVPKNHFQWFGNERVHRKIFEAEKVDLSEGTP